MGRPKKIAAKKLPPAAAPARPAVLSVRGLSEDDWLALERAVARRAEMLGGVKVPLNAAVLGLVRRACNAEDAEDAAKAASARGDTRDELVRQLVEARRAVEASARDGWPGTDADRVALVLTQEEAFVALARHTGLASGRDGEG